MANTYSMNSHISQTTGSTICKLFINTTNAINMKKLFAIISALMLTLTASAQDGEVGQFTVQPMVGLSTGSAFNSSYQADDPIQAHTGLGFGLGVDLGYRASQVFYPTVGAYLIQSRVNFDMGRYDGNITTTNLAIPVLANFNISGLRLGVGVQPTFNLSKSANNMQLTGIKNGIKSTTIAVPVVLGYELNNGITFEYRLALDVTKSVDYSLGDDFLRTNNLTSLFTIGYKFKM